MLVTMQNAYSKTERVVIRRALLAYAKEHGIGLTALADRIATANELKETLYWQRLKDFLYNIVRTEDDFVGWCDRFLEMKNARMTDPVSELGKALAAFYGGAAPPGPVEYAFCSNSDFEYSRLSVTPEGIYGRVVERYRRGQSIYDGAMVVYPPKGAFIVLTNRLTRRPKAYSLQGKAGVLVISGSSRSVSFQTKEEPSND